LKYISFVSTGVCFFLGNSPASEFYIQTFRNTSQIFPVQILQPSQT